MKNTQIGDGIMFTVKKPENKSVTSLNFNDPVKNGLGLDEWFKEVIVLKHTNN